MEKKKPKLVLDVWTVVRCPAVGCKGCVLFKDWEAKTSMRFIGKCDTCGQQYNLKPVERG